MKFDNPTIKTIYTRRSVRNYKKKLISKTIIEKIINAGVMAPSAKNTQPWNFHIVSGLKNVNHFAKYALENINLIIKTGIKLTIKSLFFNAPLLIIISGKKDYKWLNIDTNLCVENMFLAAKSYGIGSCWIGYAMNLDKNKKARKELCIPNNHKICAILIFGYPKSNKEYIHKRSPKIKKWIK